MKRSLIYWKGRKIDADAAVRQARAHLTEMEQCKRFAERKVREYEQKILVRG